MRTLWNASRTAGGVLIVAAAVGVIYLAVTSISDVARYREIRRM